MSGKLNPKWNKLFSDEAQFSKQVFDELKNVNWCNRLIRRLSKKNGQFDTEDMPDLFELRFAGELHRTGIEPVYEFSTGVGNSNVDFMIPGNPGWLVELHAIQESEAVGNNTFSEESEQGYPMQTCIMSANTTNTSPGLGEEMVRVQSIIASKVCHKQFDQSLVPHKFPIPKDYLHAIVMDVRGYNGGDGMLIEEKLQIAYGYRGLEKYDFLDRAIYITEKPVYEGEQPRDRFIRGIFEPENERENIKFIQKRVHLLILVDEKKFEPGAMIGKSFFAHNIMMKKCSTFSDLFPLQKIPRSANHS